ncbi:MAG: hypothetical protein E6I27_04175 [Chloroflexi bacterium]|nr:MAG: hypothetical protein E6I27_04175 [Chloroflexota bacterium]
MLRPDLGVCPLMERTILGLGLSDLVIPRHSSTAACAQRTVPLWHLMLVVILTVWLLAAVYAFSEWVAPALLSRAPSTTPSGTNYVQSFGTPFIKTFGLWMTGVLFVLGPFVAVWKALERGGEAVMGKALGTTSNRCSRR